MHGNIVLPVWWVKLMKSRFARERQEALSIALSKFPANQLSDYWPFFVYMYEAMDREQRKYLFAIRDRIVQELGLDMRMYPLPPSYSQFVSNRRSAPSMQAFVAERGQTIGQYIPGYDDDPLSDFDGNGSGGSGSSDFNSWDFDYSGQGQTQQQPRQSRQPSQGYNPLSDPSGWADLIKAGVQAGTSIYNTATGQGQTQSPQGQTQWGQGGAVPTYAPTTPTTPKTPTTTTAPTVPTATTTQAGGLSWWQWLALLAGGAGAGFAISKAME